MHKIDVESQDFHIIQGFTGKEIKSIEINEFGDKDQVYDSFVLIRFSDDSRLKLSDRPTCCAVRYMKTDDDIMSLVGDKFKGVEIKSCGEAEDIEGDNDCHEVLFMEIQSDKSFITICSHNEHHGYYSGFDLRVEEGT